MRSRLIAARTNEVRDSSWLLVQHDDRSLHVEQEATYHATGETLRRCVPINDFLREGGPPPRWLQALVDRMFDGERETTMDKVYVLRHQYENFDELEDKFIGVYRSRSLAETAVKRLVDKPGFRDHPDGFRIGEVPLDKDHGWTEGFITWAEALSSLKDDPENG